MELIRIEGRQAMRSIMTVITLSTVLVAAAPGAHAGEVLKHSGQAVQHSAAAAGEFLSAGFKLAAVAVSVPVKVLDAAGDEAARAAALSRESANASAALPLTDEVLTAHRRPAEALRVMPD